MVNKITNIETYGFKCPNCHEFFHATVETSIKIKSKIVDTGSLNPVLVSDGYIYKCPTCGEDLLCLEGNVATSVSALIDVGIETRMSCGGHHNKYFMVTDDMITRGPWIDLYMSDEDFTKLCTLINRHIEYMSQMQPWHTVDMVIGASKIVNMHEEIGVAERPFIRLFAYDRKRGVENDPMSSRILTSEDIVHSTYADKIPLFEYVRLNRTLGTAMEFFIDKYFIPYIVENAELDELFKVPPRLQLWDESDTDEAYDDDGTADED